MTVDAIKAAIEQLSEPERRELADWFDELEQEAWEAAMWAQGVKNMFCHSVPEVGRSCAFAKARDHGCLIQRISKSVSAGDFRLWIGQRECSGGAVCLFLGS